MCSSDLEPEHVEEYAQNFHGPVVFGQRTSSIELPHHWLDLRSPYYHAELWDQSMHQLSDKMRELGASAGKVYTHHTWAQLRSHEPPLPGLADVAAQLHISERTLNRRLQAEGTTYRELRAQLLNQWARLYLLETDASVEAIAMKLGYQDAANFRRAFRARTGIAPGEFRSGKAATDPRTTLR